MNFSAHEYEFGTMKIDYLGNTITPKGVLPESAKIEKLLGQIRMPNSETIESSNCLGAFFSDFQPNLGVKLLPFYKIFATRKRLHRNN